jgi:hypothetical protein
MQNIIQFGASRAVTAGYQLSTQPGVLRRIDGYCNGAAGTNTWLQIFDAAAAPATNDVPKKSLMLAEANGYSYAFLGDDEVEFSTALYVALSKDPTKYVAVTDGATTTGDVTIDDLSILSGTTKVGPTDLSSGDPAAGLQTVWDASAGNKVLVQVNFVNAAAAGTKQWLVIMAATTGFGAAVVKEAFPLYTTAAGNGQGAATIKSTLALKFGKDGYSIVAILGATTYAGCCLGVTTTADPVGKVVGDLTFSSDASTLTSYYK